MKRIAFAVVILASPVTAQEEAPSLMERGLRLFMDGLLQEMEPALRDLEGLAENAAPLLEELQRDLNETLGDLNAYGPPEILPNGDIIIRRRVPLDPELPVPNPDGSFDL
ncbi:MAG: hypothetical protein AAF919_00795 [Pseudomonadota bacterium]